MGSPTPTINWQPGDVIAFSGTSLLSRLISLWTFGPSHVAVVAGVPEHFAHPNRLRYFESTSQSDRPCCIQRRQVCGVQAHWLDDLAHYPGRVWRLEARVPLTVDQAAQLSAACMARIGRRYDYAGAALAGTTWLKRILWWRTADRTNEYCVEFVGDALFDATHSPTNPWPLKLNWGELAPGPACRALVEAGTHHWPVRVKFPRRAKASQ